MRSPERARWRMLSQVLAVMLAAVLAVQLTNFVLLQITPLPRPPVFSVEQVASVLRAGRGSTVEFRVERGEAPSETQPGMAGPMALALARSLDVPLAAIRLSFVTPPGFGDAPRRPGGGPPGAARSGDLLIGDFTVGLRQADGRWLVVRPVRSGMLAWRLRLLFWLLVALTTVAPFAWLLARWVTRPLAVFADAAARIGRDPRTPALRVAGPAEIAYAASAMNEMQDRLNRYVDDRTIMIGAIAHDLRTPLMRLALRLERAPEGLRLGVERDVADMQAMIAAATDYVRGATRGGPKRRLDLRSLAESAVDDLADQGASATLLPGDRVVVEGNPAALRALIDNLLTNALRYAGDAEVDLRTDAESIVLTVSDHGPGLPPGELETAFLPFFRGESSRSRETGGVGLGLASARSVVRLHGGEISLRNGSGGGLVAEVRLPLPTAETPP